MFCPNCGKNLEEGKAFCPNCGAAVAENNQQPFQPQVQPSVQAYDYTPQTNIAERPMKWFKFLIYFALFASAVVNFFSGISFITGTQTSNLAGGYGAGFVYAIFGGLKVLDIIVGILSFGMVALAIYVRFQLAGYKKDGPKMLLGMYAIQLAINLIYYFGLLIILGFDGTILSSLIGTIIGSVIMIVLNKIYFDKRKDLFVN